VAQRSRGPATVGRTGRVLAPVLGLAAVCALDAVQAARAWPVPVVGLLDEPAHVLTAWLALAALGLAGLRGAPAPLLPWVLIGSVALDADHVPLYLWGEPVAHQGSRPVTHAAVTVVVLLLAAALSRSRLRTAAVGLAAGVALHLVRDVATGPGVPLLWPLDATDVRVPYAAYLAVVALAAAVAALRALRRSGVSGTGG
jgi:inner membrane protein